MTAKPTAIRTIGNILWEHAMDQVARDEEVSTDELRELMEHDVNLRRQVRQYMASAYNFAMSKVPE